MQMHARVYEQERHYTCNVTMKRLQETIVVVESDK